MVRREECVTTVHHLLLKEACPHHDRHGHLCRPPAPTRGSPGTRARFFVSGVGGSWLVIGCSLGAAFGFAASTSLKHLTAAEAPDAQQLRPGQLAKFVRATVSQPVWLAGIGCDLVGLAFQLVALHRGSLSVVQPLLMTGLLFALILRPVLERQRIARGQLGWAVLLTITLAGFLLLAGSGGAGSDVDRLPAIIAAVIGTAVTVGCVLVARRRAGAASAAVLGIAVGIIYAGTAALLKNVTDIASSDHVGVLASWQLYAVAALGIGGLVLNQIAFQAGPITASLPAIATIDPLLSIVLGVLIYDEHLHRGPAGGIILVLLLALLAVATIQLTRAR
jgi:drug/metabolite transporter (DMT)-like permease